MRVMPTAIALAFAILHHLLVAPTQGFSDRSSFESCDESICVLSSDEIFVDSATASSAGGSGEIHGSKWQDLDEDGQWDTDEPGLAGWTIFIDEDGDGQLDDGESSVVTDANGDYSFTGLDSGVHVVAEVPQTDWYQTFPSGASVDSQVATRISEMSTTGSDAQAFVYGEVPEALPGNITHFTAESGDLIEMDAFRADARFSGIDGTGYATVILDTGIDLDHPFFGEDSDSDGAKVYSTEADRICPFSQRRSTLTTILAPGAVITGADSDGGTVDMHGTSQASPHIADIAVLAQQLAETALGRRLTIDEFAKLMRVSADWINDGDDENDNADHTGLDFPRVNMLALAEAILSLGGEDTHTVLLEPGEIVRDIDFGNAYSPPDRTLTISSTAGGSVATPGEGDFVFAHGATVAVSASAENLYHFLNWSGTAVDAGKIEDETSESTTVTVDADYTLVANFAEDEPVISISPESLAFDSVEVGETKDLSFTVENTGGGTLTGTASSAEPFTIESGESYSLLHGETHIVTVRFAPPSAADYSAAIACSGGDGAAVKATGTGVISPSSEYYVAPSPSGDDGNTGKSMDRPFATIQKAIDTAESNGIQPVAIHVTAGTRTENVVVPPSVEIVFDCGCDVSDGLTAIKADDKTSPTLTLSGKVTVRNLALE